MKQLIKAVGLLAMFCALGACSGPMVHTEHDKSLHFSTLHTYAWLPTAGHNGPGLPNDPTLDMRIRSYVEAELQAKGMRPVSEANADLLLDYQASAEKKVDASNLKNYETAQFMDLTYTLGTLNLNMKRPLSPAVIWQGSVQANVDMSRPLAERDAKLHEAIQELLKKFPPK